MSSFHDVHMTTARPMNELLIEDLSLIEKDPSIKFNKSQLKCIFDCTNIFHSYWFTGEPI